MRTIALNEEEYRRLNNLKFDLREKSMRGTVAKLMDIYDNSLKGKKRGEQ